LQLLLLLLLLLLFLSFSVASYSPVLKHAAHLSSFLQPLLFGLSGILPAFNNKDMAS